VIAPYGVFETADGPLNLAPITTGMWQRLCQLLDLPQLPDDPRFATNEARVANRDVLKAVLETRLKTRGKRAWTDLFVAAGLPAGPIHTLDEVFADVQVQHCGLVETIQHATLGALRQIPTPVFGTAAQSGGAQRHPTRHAAPALGEHTTEVLREAGFDPTDIDALLAAGVVHQAPPIEAQQSISGVAQ
jgi:formyl-CoA transferase